MATLTIKNIPDALYDQIKETASKNRRSINSEVIVCLERSMLTPKLDTATVLERIREVRKRTSGHLLLDKELSKAKNEGRP